jgi:hypothetical protein
MPIKIAASRQALADRYGQLGNFFGACRGDPGTTSTPANEASGGGYVRVAGTWVPNNNGTLICSPLDVLLTVPAATYTYGTLCSSASGGSQVDNASHASMAFTAPGQLIYTPGYVQT